MLAKSAAKLKGARWLSERRLLRKIRGTSSVSRYTILGGGRGGEGREGREGGREGGEGHLMHIGIP